MRLLKIGDNSGEYHLFAGKYHLIRELYDISRRGPKNGAGAYRGAFKSGGRL